MLLSKAARQLENLITGNPGRVVNLLPSEDPDSVVWGVAFQIDDDLWTNEVSFKLSHLGRDIEILRLDVYGQGGEPEAGFLNAKVAPYGVT